METNEATNAVEIATELTIAWLSNPNTRVTAEEVPGFMNAMHAAIVQLHAGADVPAEAAAEEPVAGKVSVKKSLASDDHIISMIDGKPYKTLRRHLSTHGFTPEQYRERYNLRPDYPMVARSYSQERSAMARRIGLGRKPAVAEQPAPAPVPAPEPVQEAAPRRRGRRPKA